ncbi:uncharacterized protein BO97DRAFT_107557 [Aspergillus homomorphus CBS 101889]|uniref:Secreted protein n=1 Tax=Aspergillus homomorphus (strain CBS 101889) TaxID=1450537 RepID=A0A395HV23_ASPHC|nr:hypothetical protein BO97DRAFT_107557 [Aspergillus homomorphus CBS 101889]RAL11235.1 hypothetical protein BO97DRAFT_107557 [Aspergillus homomorphus CBS 101889]
MTLMIMVVFASRPTHACVFSALQRWRRANSKLCSLGKGFLPFIFLESVEQRQRLDYFGLYSTCFTLLRAVSFAPLAAGSRHMFHFLNCL